MERRTQMNKITRYLAEKDFVRGMGAPLFVDAWLYAAIIALCFFSFNHTDILYVIAHAAAPLNGHISDFYEAVSPLAGYSNYLPATYVVFSLWGIPLKLLGFMKSVALPDPVWLFFWFKLMTALFFAGSGVLIYKICREYFGEPRRAFLAAAIWLSSPVAIFSQFIFGQYDVITVFFMLLGLLYYVRGNLLLFSFWFGISVAFKYFPFFVFFPLLALREKNLKKLLFYSAVFGAPNLVQIVLFLHSQDFIAGVLGFGAAKRALNKDLFLWPLICVYAYLVNYKDRLPRDLHFSARLSLFSLALVFWHSGPYPQWFLILTPFIAIVLAGSKNIKSMLLVDMVFALAFFSFTFRAYASAVDTNLFYQGLWGLLNPAFAAAGELTQLSSVGVYTFLGKKTLFRLIMLSLAVMAIFSKSYPWKTSEATSHPIPPYGLVRLRFYGVIGLFLVSAFYAYYKTLTV